VQFSIGPGNGSKIGLGTVHWMHVPHRIRVCRKRFFNAEDHEVDLAFKSSLNTDLQAMDLIISKGDENLPLCCVLIDGKYLVAVYLL
jgi:hypothetical protein